MALIYDPDSREAVVCSAWGSNTEWIRNLRAHPALQIQIGRDSYAPKQRFLSEDESVAVVVAFRRRHPWRARLLASILGWGDLSSETAVGSSSAPAHSSCSGRCALPRPRCLAHTGSERLRRCLPRRSTGPDRRPRFRRHRGWMTGSGMRRAARPARSRCGRGCTGRTGRCFGCLSGWLLSLRLRSPSTGPSSQEGRPYQPHPRLLRSTRRTGVVADDAAAAVVGKYRGRIPELMAEKWHEAQHL